MSDVAGVTLVKAIYSFKGSHNDELNFKKGAVITLTQKEDGGWWEGTLDGKTGWFPSNYVKELETGGANASAAAPSAVTAAAANADEIAANRLEFRHQLVRDVLEKEREFVLEMRATLVKKYLAPLRLRPDIFPESDYRQLAANLDGLLGAHDSMNAALAEATAAGIPPREQRVGRAFLAHGAAVRAAHLAYWAGHPRAVAAIERNRDRIDKFIEEQGSPTPGLMHLMTYLSKPFRHLEKYPAATQEIEQHLEDDHPDRGDTQRSIGFYKSVASECAKIRRQKELELEVLTTAIRDWEGEHISTLGDVLHLGAVSIVVPATAERTDRYLVLFPQYLLVLSVSARMSAFIYQGKLPLSGISANRLEDTEAVTNSFEITGSMIERIVATCVTKADSLKWIECLQHQIKASRQPATHQATPSHRSVQSSPQTKRPHKIGHGGYLWKMSCLRPAPPTRSYIMPDGKKTVRKKDPDSTYEEDMQILRVIEAYCTTNKRQTQAQLELLEQQQSPPVLLADDDAAIEVSSNGAEAFDERTIVETVYTLRDQVLHLAQQNQDLFRMVEEEIAARKKLEAEMREKPQQQILSSDLEGTSI